MFAEQIIHLQQCTGLVTLAPEYFARYIHVKRLAQTLVCMV